MRYYSKYDSYYIYISGEGEKRRLYYHVDGDGLVLTYLGEDGNDNSIALANVSWDRK